jgi:hypothetical protein
VLAPFHPEVRYRPKVFFPVHPAKFLTLQVPKNYNAFNLKINGN